MVAPEAVISVLPPVHMLADTGVAVTVGTAFTVIVCVVVFTQPDALVPVIV